MNATDFQNIKLYQWIFTSFYFLCPPNRLLLSLFIIYFLYIVYVYGFYSIFGIFSIVFDISSSLGRSNLNLGRWFGLGQGHFLVRTIPEIVFVSISFDRRGKEGLSVNRHKSFRRSVATLGRPLEQLQSSSYKRRRSSIHVRRSYLLIHHTGQGDSRPILPTCPKLYDYNNIGLLHTVCIRKHFLGWAI